MTLTEEMKQELIAQKNLRLDSESVSKCLRTYKCKKRYSSRKEEGCAIRKEFPDKIPVIVERYTKERYLPILDKSRYLVPQDITMSQLVTIVRNRMELTSTQALFMLVNSKSMLSMSRTLAEVYSEYKSDDGFLYITYASQEVFG